MLFHLHQSRGVDNDLAKDLLQTVQPLEDILSQPQKHL